MVAFDNDQVVGKSWRISTDDKVKSFCVTSICTVAIDTGSCQLSNEQFKTAVHPKNWFNYTEFVQKLENIRNQDGTYFDAVYDIHYQLLCHKLNKHMSHMYQEQISCYVDGVFCDKIDQSITAKQSEQLVILNCVLYGSVYQTSKIKCNACKVNLRASQKYSEEKKKKKKN